MVSVRGHTGGRWEVWRQQPITSSTIYGLVAAGAVITKQDRSGWNELPSAAGWPLLVCDMTANTVSRRLIRTKSTGETYCCAVYHRLLYAIQRLSNCVSVDRVSTLQLHRDAANTAALWLQWGVYGAKVTSWHDVTWHSLYPLSQTSHRAQWS